MSGPGIEAPDASLRQSNQALHVILNLVNTAALLFVGFIIKLAFTEISALRESQEQFPLNYVQKYDYSEDQRQLMGAMEAMRMDIKNNLQSQQESTERRILVQQTDFDRRLDKLETRLIDMLSEISEKSGR